MFVSYAQNLEDVMLWRALREVVGGFWIDVGAGHPTTDSVTRAFSERGWRGINVEPDPVHFAPLVAARPRDVNLLVALAADPGERLLHHIPGSGLSTFDTAIAARHGAEGRAVEAITVAATTLAEVCRAHAPAEVHFLKVDVEGAEREVLLGADFAAFRPWIVLVESTLPNSQVESWAEWEPILLDAGYRFVWFDGLNRFYVAGEREAALAPHFRTPANVFDGFTRYDAAADADRRRLVALEADLDALRGAQERLRDALEAASGLAAAATAERDRQRAELDELRAAPPPPSPAARPAPYVRAEAAPPGAVAAGPAPARGPLSALALLAWRAVRPVARPLMWRVRTFLTQDTQLRLDAVDRAVGGAAERAGAIDVGVEGINGRLDWMNGRMSDMRGKLIDTNDRLAETRRALLRLEAGQRALEATLRALVEAPPGQPDLRPVYESAEQVRALARLAESALVSVQPRPSAAASRRA